MPPVELTRKTNKDFKAILDAQPHISLEYSNLLALCGIALQEHWETPTLVGKFQAIATAFATLLENRVSTRELIRVVSYLLDAWPLDLNIAHSLDYCNFLGSYSLIVDSLSSEKVVFGSISVKRRVFDRLEIFQRKSREKNTARRHALPERIYPLLRYCGPEKQILLSRFPTL